MTWYIQNQGENNMSKKKSYMDKSHILKEGFLTKFFKLLTRGKGSKELNKAVKQIPSFRKRVKKFNNEHDDFMKWLQKNLPEKDPLGKGWKR